MKLNAELPTCADGADDARRHAYAEADRRRSRQLHTLDETRAARLAKITRDYDTAHDGNAVRRRDRALRHLERTCDRRCQHIRAQWRASLAAADAAWVAATGAAARR